MQKKLGKGVAALLALATLCGVLAFVSLWADRQLLQTDNWTETSTELLERPAVRDAVSAYLVDQLFSNVDVSGQLRENLPGDLKGLAGPAAAGMRQLASQASDRALANPRVQSMWRKANEKSHATLMRILDGDGKTISIAGGAVTLDTRLLLTDLAKQLGIGEKLVAKLPPGVGEIVIMRSDELRTAQNTAKAVRGFALVFTILTVLLFAAAIWLAGGRRRRALAFTGAAFVSVGSMVLILTAVIKAPVIDGFASTASVKPAVAEVFSVTTGLLRAQAASTIVSGMLILTAAWLGGPSRVAVGFRRTTAPFLRDQLPASAAFAAVVFLLVAWWSPTLAFTSATGLIFNLLLLVAGFTALTRITRREFPDVPAVDFSELAGNAKDKLRSASVAVRGIGGNRRDGSSLGELERLAQLRDQGVLTDEEFAEQKSKLLA